MSRKSSSPPPVEITAEMRREFDRNAPAALARRNDAYLGGVAMNVGQWLLIGALGLLGIYHWEWTASEMLLVFVAGIVAAIFADCLKWLVARNTLRGEYQKMQDDRLVWAIQTADALKSGTIPASQLQPTSPGPALVLDILPGALGMWLIWPRLPAFGLNVDSLDQLNTGVALAILFVLLAPLVSLVTAKFAQQRAEGGYDDLEFRAGGRGFGLVILAVAIGVVGDGESAARSIMLFVNWATIVVGLISVGGVAIMYGQRNALRQRLAAGSDAASKVA